MAKLLNMLITIPFIVTPVAIPAAAEMVSPNEALQIMAKSEAASAKCGVLMGSERNELKQYIARAEIAAARRMGPEEASATVMSGRAAGRAVSCNGATTAEIYEALTAARIAVAQADGSRRAKPSLFTNSRSVRLSSSTAPVTLERQPAAPRGSLARFQQASTAYFIEKRCRFLPYSRARNFWQSVVGAQSEAMAANTRGQVNAVLRQARAIAARTACDSQAAGIVRSASASLAAN
ncbi:MAG: hypothetical protein JNM20_18170 [Rhizobiales bacterium]|nr:hypothetical protein [Hyphomicrobiales bacterium]